MEQIFFDFLAFRAIEGKDIYSDETRYNKHVKPFFKNIAIKNITPEMLDKFKAQMLASKQSASSVIKLFGSLRSSVNFAIKRGHYTGPNPFSTQTSTLTLPREDNESERFLTSDEVDSLLKALEIRSHRLYAMSVISLRTGMRATEIFKLRGRDIDEHNKVANIYSKGGEREVVLLQDKVLEILLQYRTSSAALLFPKPKKPGEPLDQIPRSFKDTVEKLGLNADCTDNKQKVTFHTLRHTFASWLAQSGRVSLHELMKLMRHKNIDMTLRYAHLIPDKQREHLNIVDEVLNSRQ